MASFKKEIEGKWFKKQNDLLTLMLSDIRDENTTPLELLEKRYANRIRRIYQRNEEDYFSIIINTFTKQFDPHSAYLSPKNAEDFDMQMSLSLEGIGALLGIEDDYAKIVSLVPVGLQINLMNFSLMIELSPSGRQMKKTELTLLDGELMRL